MRAEKVSFIIKGDVEYFVYIEIIFVPTMKLLYFLIFFKTLGALPFVHGVMGGYRAYSSEWATAGSTVFICPWQEEVRNDTEVEAATGVLITRRHVVTGAFVFLNEKDKGKMYILIGTTSIWDDHAQVYHMSAIARAGFTKPADYEADLVVLKLDRNAHYNPDVTVAPLGNTEHLAVVHVNDSLEVMGFGLTHANFGGGEMEPKLHYLSVSRQDDEACHSLFTNIATASKTIQLRDAYWCFGSHVKIAYATKRPTIGDYGAPLNYERKVVVGISLFHTVPNSKSKYDPFPTPYIMFTDYVRERIWNLVYQLK